VLAHPCGHGWQSRPCSCWSRRPCGCWPRAACALAGREPPVRLLAASRPCGCWPRANRVVAGRGRTMPAPAAGAGLCPREAGARHARQAVACLRASAVPAARSRCRARVEPGSAVSHPVLEGKPNANHVRARISYSRTQRLHNMDIITQCSK
jgi:hypothetical protein